MSYIDLALSLGLTIEYVVCDTAYIDTNIKRKAAEKGILVITDKKFCESGFWRNKYNEGLHHITLMEQRNVFFLSCVADICGILNVLKLLISKGKTKAA